MKAKLFIPLYNEGTRHDSDVSNVFRTLSKVYKYYTQQLFDEILLVDDGSTDDSVDQVKLFMAQVDGGITLLRHPTNRGKGAAFLTAYEHLAGSGSDHLVMTDADMLEDNNVFESLLHSISKSILSKNYMVVVPAYEGHQAVIPIDISGTRYLYLPSWRYLRDTYGEQRLHDVLLSGRYSLEVALQYLYQGHTAYLHLLTKSFVHPVFEDAFKYSTYKEQGEDMQTAAQTFVRHFGEGKHLLDNAMFEYAKKLPFVIK
ncbi:MAG: glycosyltransferase [Candidatus Absconditabacterales bacterium]